jgi:hypothetical protein
LDAGEHQQEHGEHRAGVLLKVRTAAMSEGSIVLLAGEGAATSIVYHALQERFGSETRLEVIIEERPSRLQLLHRRVKRLGVLTVLGHVLFMSVIVPVLRVRRSS